MFTFTAFTDREQDIGVSDDGILPAPSRKVNVVRVLNHKKLNGAIEAAVDALDKGGDEDEMIEAFIRKLDAEAPEDK